MLHEPDARGFDIRRLLDTAAGLARLDVSSLPSHDLDFKVLSAGSAVGSGEADPVGRLRSIRGVEGQVWILCQHRRTRRQRLAEIFRHKKVSLTRERVHLAVGALSRGFRIPELALTVISNVEFAGVPQPVRVRERAPVPSKAVAELLRARPRRPGGARRARHRAVRGDGAGPSAATGAEDHLRLCFRNDVRLLVPASKIHLVQKYIGAA